MLHHQQLADMSQAHLFDGELLHCLLCYKLSVFQSDKHKAGELADFNSLILHLFAL
jgi:hypothetical protein